MESLQQVGIGAVHRCDEVVDRLFIDVAEAAPNHTDTRQGLGLLREALAPPTAGLSEGEPPTRGAAEAEKVEAITQSIMGELVREAVVDVVPQAAAPTVGQSLDESGTLSDFGVDYTESFDDLQ